MFQSAATISYLILSLQPPPSSLRLQICNPTVEHRFRHWPPSFRHRLPPRLRRLKVEDVSTQHLIVKVYDDERLQPISFISWA
ncbi:hypothetical protein L1987_54748 [Smallanthus sonchifolius]|uniref:Uncharacterized protein n=1 Tax=Smallanthus sonchifolius TaxID=185202 RepID=A0ACB9E8C0_9ASTR|nr:hypothetical protein L1987_54748 [Smallanthus sonchifolius]